MEVVRVDRNRPKVGNFNLRCQSVETLHWGLCSHPCNYKQMQKRGKKDTTHTLTHTYTFVHWPPASNHHARVCPGNVCVCVCVCVCVSLILGLVGQRPLVQAMRVCACNSRSPAEQEEVPPVPNKSYLCPRSNDGKHFPLHLTCS